MPLELNKYEDLGELEYTQVDQNWNDIIAFTEKAGAESIRDGTSGEVVTVLPMYQACVPVVSSGAGGWAIDFRDGIVFVRELTGNSTFGNGIGRVVGKTGLIYFVQDATGGRTLTFGTDYNHIGGPPSISLAPSAVNLFSYYIRQNTPTFEIDLNYLGVVE